MSHDYRSKTTHDGNHPGLVAERQPHRIADCCHAPNQIKMLSHFDILKHKTEAQNRRFTALETPVARRR